MQELEKAYNKQSKLDRSGTQDTSYWRKTLLDDVCSENFKNVLNNSTQCLAVDNLSTFDEAQVAPRKFCRNLFTDGSETWLSFLGTFDAVMTND